MIDIKEKEDQILHINLQIKTDNTHSDRVWKQIKWLRPFSLKSYFSWVVGKKNLLIYLHMTIDARKTGQTLTKESPNY